MTEASPTAPPTPAPPDAPPPAAARASISFGRAMGAATLVFALSLGAGLAGALATAASIAVAALFLLWAWRRGVLRAQPMVMAEVTWLVLGVILKLAFLEQMPAAPLPVLAGILLVQYLAQLLVDLAPFAGAGDGVPPVTYSITFALAPLLAVAAELFRAARSNYSPVAGVFLAMTLAASAFLLLVVWWDWTRKAFSSLKMAVTLISLIGVGSIVGTFVIQHLPEDSIQAHYEKFMNGEGAAPVNARYLFQDPAIEWSDEDESRRTAMNDAFGSGQGDRWAKMVRHDRVKKAKEEEGRRWVASNRKELHAFYEHCEEAEFTRIFKSWYFNALLALLAATVVGVMVRRFPYELRDFGWVSTHTGIVFLLLCLAASDLNVEDGFVQLAPTASPGGSGLPTETRSFEDISAANKSRDFPFTLRLVRTSADWYQELVVAFAGERGGVAAERSYPVLPGKVIELERPSKTEPPRYRIEVLDVLERCRTTRVGYRPGETSGVTAMQLLLSADETHGPTEHWITDEDESPLALPGAQLRFVAARTDADADAWLAPHIAPDTGSVGFLRVVAGERDLVRIPATVGGTAEFGHGGKTWRLTVAETALDIKRALQERSLPAEKRTPVESQIPDIGGATLSLSAEGVEPQRASAFSGEYADLANGQMANPVLKEAGLSFYLDFVVPTEVRVIVRPDGSISFVEEDRGTVSAPRTLRANDPLPARGASISVGTLVRDADLDVGVEPLAPESDEDYMRNGLSGINEQVGRPAVRIRVSEPGSEPYEQWLLGGDPWERTPVIESRDHRLRMLLTSTSESMYRSAVQALDSKGSVLGEHVVRVNTPFRMRGYEFYQNQFQRPDQGGPLSVFRVKYDVFVPFIYLGFVLVASGVIVLLWFPGQRAFKLHAHLARLPEEGPRS